VKSIHRALTRIHVIVLILLVLATVFAGAFYVYSSRLTNKGSALPQASPSESPSPVSSLPETAALTPTASPSPVGDSYEPDNSFDQYSTYNYSSHYSTYNYSMVDTTVDYFSRQDRTIFPVGDQD
jgi:hypothetical protein